MKPAQTMIMLMVFMAIAITVTSATVVISISNTQNNTRTQFANEALAVAESGMENALLRILRDPAYAGETLPVGYGTATITLSGTNPVVITSVGQVGNYQKTVRVTGAFVGVIFNIYTWSQVY